MTRRPRRALLALLAPLVALLPAAGPALAQGFSGLMSGSWWDASRAGEGQFITFETVAGRNVVYLAYFTYNAEGVATWQVGNIDHAAGATRLEIPLVTGSGPRFGAGFDPAALSRISVGTATLERLSCNRIRMRHSAMPGVTLNLTRLVGPLDGHPCSDAAPASLVVSGPTPFAAACSASAGTAFPNAEVEPHLAVNPANPANLLAMWQQDRWSNGGARGLVSAVSFDRGATWTARAMPFSRCGGGAPGNGGDYDRASDPWVSFSPDGTAWAMSLSLTGTTFAAGSANAMLVARSTDGGRNWSGAVPLIVDDAAFFNDKNAITADPYDARYAYAVWDRLRPDGNGPAMFARTVDGGASWEAARPILQPGGSNQTIGNLVLAPTPGALVNVATLLETGAGGSRTAAIVSLRSPDRGATWSAPAKAADLLGVTTRDPESGAVIRDGGILPQAAAGPGGVLHLVWQDARFSGGARNAIAYARSADGGISWSAPVRVNAEPGVHAFTPGVHVLADGTLGVTYYDLRDNTADAATLPAGYWLARSRDGVTWWETRLAGPFDLSGAPSANGLFLGDYMGLAGDGGEFLSLHGRATGNPANRTDVHFQRIAAIALDKAGEAAPGVARVAETAAPFAVDEAWRRDTAEAITRALAARNRPGSAP